MAVLETKKCLERHLMALTPALPTSFEGVSFDPPATMYQSCQLRIDSPDDPTLSAGVGVGFYRERIQFQVFVVDASNNGTASAIQRAELIRDWFKKGSTFQEGAFRIHILATPKVSSSAQINTRTVVPIMIDVVTEVYS
jgi:hypothetical protein